MKKTLRIGFDARLYSQTGIGRYIRNILSELKKIDFDNVYYVFLQGQDYYDFDLPNDKWHKVLLDVSWHSIAEQMTVPFILSRKKLDVAHFPYFNVPIFYRGKFLLTIHDMIVDHFNTGRASTLSLPVYKMKRLGYRVVTSFALSKANVIAAISHTTKREITDHYAINPEKIKVTYDGLDDNFVNLVKKKSPRSYYNFPYIIYVGNAYPHKNLERLLEAFKKLPKRNDLKLVLVGKDDFFYPRLENYAKEIDISDDIVFFGEANDKELIDLYSHARLLIFPSLMEGFGLPNLEALTCDCLPVVSDIPVFREIWQDQLIYFDPQDTNSVIRSITQALNLSQTEYKKKVQIAKRKLKDFSWKETARQTLILYKAISC